MVHLQNTGRKLMKVCNIAATKQLESLKERKKLVHEGVKYQCKNCSYGATIIGHLKEHKRKGMKESNILVHILNMKYAN